MRASQKVPQRHEFAMALVLDIDHAPPVLAAADLLSAYDDVLLRAHDGERDQFFHFGILGTFLLIVLLVVVGEHAQVVEGKLFSDALFEGIAFFES